MVRVFPMIVGAGVGGVDGALEVADLRAGRVTNTRQYSTWFEAAAFGGGLLLNLMRFSDDITDPLTFSGLALLSRRAGKAVMQSQAAPAPLSYALPMPAYSAVRQAGAYSPYDRVQPTGILG